MNFIAKYVIIYIIKVENSFEGLKMVKIISVSNQKGGAGKTTTSSILAMALKSKGFKVLAVDMDPQGNLGFSLGADSQMSATLYDILRGDVKTRHAIQHTPAADVISSNILLSGIEMEFTDRGREFLLTRALESVKDFYDYIIVDTPPGLGILTTNAFTASHDIIVPVQPDIFSLMGVTQLFDTVEAVRKMANPNIKICGILLTKFNPRTKLSQEIKGTARMIAEDLEIPMFNTYIRYSTALSEAQSMQQNPLTYAPRSPAVIDYKIWINEFLARGI